MKQIRFGEGSQLRRESHAILSKCSDVENAERVQAGRLCTAHEHAKSTLTGRQMSADGLG